MGTGSFSEVKSGQGVTLTPHPLLVPWSWQVELYLYSPYGPYGLYRASVPVQGWHLPLHYNYLNNASYNYLISNKVLLAECDKGQLALNVAVTTSCFKSRL